MFICFWSAFHFYFHFLSYSEVSELLLLQEGSSLECSSHLRFCRAKNIFFDFRNLNAKTSKRFGWWNFLVLPLFCIVLAALMDDFWLSKILSEDDFIFMQTRLGYNESRKIQTFARSCNNQQKHYIIWWTGLFLTVCPHILSAISRTKKSCPITLKRDPGCLWSWKCQSYHSSDCKFTCQ